MQEVESLPVHMKSWVGLERWPCGPRCNPSAAEVEAEGADVQLTLGYLGS